MLTSAAARPPYTVFESQEGRKELENEHRRALFPKGTVRNWRMLCTAGSRGQWLPVSVGKGGAQEPEGDLSPSGTLAGRLGTLRDIKSRSVQQWGSICSRVLHEPKMQKEQPFPTLQRNPETGEQELGSHLNCTPDLGLEGISGLRSLASLESKDDG